MSQRSLARPINAPDIFEIGFWTVPESAFTFITSTTRTKKHEICSPHARNILPSLFLYTVTVHTA